jgi:hypothetical protein
MNFAQRSGAALVSRVFRRRSHWPNHGELEGGNSFLSWHTFGTEAIFGKIDLSKTFAAKGLRLQLSRKRRGGDSFNDLFIRFKNAA